MNPVDLFGRMIEKNFEKRPILVRGIIRAGYAAQQMLLNMNPDQGLLPSQQYLAKICMKYTRKPLQNPESSALVNLFFPCELLHAMDIAPQCVEGFSAFLCGGRGEHGYLKFAEEKGVPDTYCSYHPTFPDFITMAELFPATGIAPSACSPSMGVIVNKKSPFLAEKNPYR